MSISLTTILPTFLLDTHVYFIFFFNIILCTYCWLNYIDYSIVDIGKEIFEDEDFSAFTMSSVLLLFSYYIQTSGQLLPKFSCRIYIYMYIIWLIYCIMWYTDDRNRFVSVLNHFCWIYFKEVWNDPDFWDFYLFSILFYLSYILLFKKKFMNFSNIFNIFKKILYKFIWNKYILFIRIITLISRKKLISIHHNITE